VILGSFIDSSYISPPYVPISKDLPSKLSYTLRISDSYAFLTNSFNLNELIGPFLMFLVSKMHILVSLPPEIK